MGWYCVFGDRDEDRVWSELLRFDLIRFSSRPAARFVGLV